MRFGVFYELQLPRPWNKGDERNLFHQALHQVQLADRLGFDYAWEVDTTSSKNILIPRRPKFSSLPPRLSPNPSASVTASGR
jgi:alkanesulfonate monooxygenase SsuD/methylene tetrahydromethanopterin reductase-like flavin-dependent oxidoreductase (luciferase family)